LANLTQASGLANGHDDLSIPRLVQFANILYSFKYYLVCIGKVIHQSFNYFTGRDSHITQIAAISNHGSSFSCYILPQRPISTKASEVTGLKVRGQQLFHKGKPVSSLSIKDALQSFIGYLESHPAQVILIGHNIKVFDCHVLMNALQSCHLQTQFCASTAGYLDTLLLFKLIKPGLESYTQVNLAKSLLGEDQCQYEAHNAFHDVRALQLIVESQSVSPEAKMKATFGHKYVLDALQYSNDININIGSFDILVKQKVISHCIARKIAGSGLCYEHLAIVYHRNGEDGVRNLLTETDQSRVRVTRSAKIIQGICKFLKNDQM
jgi:DNA polymerase III epsilon subunit-like protein